MGKDTFCEDLIVDILSCLPAKSTLRFKSLSKYYNEVISDPSFGVNHALRSTAEVHGLLHFTDIDPGKVRYFPLDSERDFYEPEDFINFCPIIADRNGLLVVVHSRSTLCVLNPTIDKFRIIPKSKNASSLSKWNIGLAYDPLRFSSLDYKLVNVYREQIIAHGGGEHYCFEMFDFSKGTWRQTRLRLRCRMGEFFRLKGHAAYLDGNLHWLRVCGDVIGYDVEVEKPKLISMPREMKLEWRGHEDDTWFGAANGLLYLIYVSDGEVLMWVLHDYKNMMWGLVRNQIKGLPEEARPIFFDGERLVFECRQQNEREIRVYNMKLETWRTVGKLPGAIEGFNDYTPFVPTLAPNSVDGFTEDFEDMMSRRDRNRKRKEPQVSSDYNLRSKAKKKETLKLAGSA